MFFGKLQSLAVSLTPYLTAHLVKGFHCPLNDMEGIDASFAVGGEFIHAFRDLLRPIAGDYPDRGKLLWRKLPVKLRQDTFAVPLRRPHDRVCIVVDDDRDVLVTFLIAGLVDADIHEIVKPSGTLRLNVVQCPVHAPSDRFPVDAHILGYGASGQICREPSDREVKVLCKAVAQVCPRDIGDKDTMNGTFNAMCPAFDLHQRPSPVKPSPYPGEAALGIITLTTPMAERTVILMSPVRSGFDPDMSNSILIGVEISTFYHCTLDI